MYVVARAVSLWVLGVLLRMAGHGVCSPSSLCLKGIEIQEPIRLLVRILVTDTIESGMQEGFTRGEWRHVQPHDVGCRIRQPQPSSFDTDFGVCVLGR